MLFISLPSLSKSSRRHLSFVTSEDDGAELEPARSCDGTGNGRVSSNELRSCSFSVDVWIISIIVRAERCTRTSRGHDWRQCNSISTQPGVRPRILTKDGVMERFRRTKHPLFKMDLFVWKFFIARMVRRAIWYTWDWMEDPPLRGSFLLPLSRSIDERRRGKSV